MDLTQVLHRIFTDPLHLQSDFARTHDQQIAALASMGMITTQETLDTYGRRWRVTVRGLVYLGQEGLV